MVGKSSKPVTEIIIRSFVSEYRAGPVDLATSPRSQTEPKDRSPRGLKSFDFGGVGLGIVASLEKSVSDNKALFSRNLSRSGPIPVKSNNNSPRTCGNSEETMEMESSEEYTIVTRHRPNKSYTKVYTNEVEGVEISDDKIPYRTQSIVFHISPSRIGEVAGIPAPDFLSACNLCRKELHGVDIYMYRGEKAFCSSECRYRQITMDERLEKYSSRPLELVANGSPYTNGQVLTNGILAI